MKTVLKESRAHERGQVIVEGFIAIAIFLAFVYYTLHICTVSLTETRKFRLTEGEQNEAQEFRLKRR